MFAIVQNFVKINLVDCEISQFFDFQVGRRLPSWIFYPARQTCGLYILLALISFFYSFIYWTDFHDLFTKWKVFA